MLSGWPLPGAVATLAALALCLAASGGMKAFHLAVTGEPAARVVGRCALVRDGREATVELEGAVPLERAFTGERITCLLEAQGRVAVEIVHDGGRSRATTGGGTIRLAAR